MSQDSIRQGHSYAHLRAWRRHRKLALHEVGRLIGVAHTTIGRWERGQMRLSVRDLEALAAVYQVSPSQLMAPPGAAEIVSRLDRAQRIIEHMDDDTLAQWLAIGDRLARSSR